MSTVSHPTNRLQLWLHRRECAQPRRALVPLLARSGGLLSLAGLASCDSPVSHCPKGLLRLLTALLQLPLPLQLQAQSKSVLLTHRHTTFQGCL